MRLLLRLYPRRWRERYGAELLELLESEPVTWRVRVDVVVAAVRERVHGSGRPESRVLWGWSLFVVGGMAFQKTSEHWQTVIPTADRGIPTAAFDAVQAAAAIGAAAVLVGVLLALPAFLHDLGNGGWAAVRLQLLIASLATVTAAAALVTVALSGGAFSAWALVASVVCSLFAWTHAAATAGRRLPPLRVHSYLTLAVAGSMVAVMTAAAVWTVSVASAAPSFVGPAHLAVIATFTFAGLAIAGAAVRSPHAGGRAMP